LIYFIRLIRHDAHCAAGGMVERAVPYAVFGTLLIVGTSVGIEVAHHGDKVGGEAIKAAADRVLYAAKDTGKRPPVIATAA
jgi:predicted signal transduction protein with EAL and GGDEF domain